MIKMKLNPPSTAMILYITTYHTNVLRKVIFCPLVFYVHRSKGLWDCSLVAGAVLSSDGVCYVFKAN